MRLQRMADGKGVCNVRNMHPFPNSAFVWRFTKALPGTSALQMQMKIFWGFVCVCNAWLMRKAFATPGHHIKVCRRSFVLSAQSINTFY
jgi:hypothetical protein